MTPWGINAFQNYLDARTRSSPPAEWREYDSTDLLYASKASKGSLHILVDSGSADDFGKKGQLQPEVFKKAAQDTGRGDDEVNVRIQEGFDHSYYFVGSPCLKPLFFSGETLFVYSQVSKTEAAQAIQEH